MSKFFRGLASVGALFMGIYLANEYISSKATGERNPEDSKGDYYNWKGLNIFYKTCGEGSPVLLVHDISPESSLREWKFITPLLAEGHKVYAVDLPGCGNSAKPSTEYNPYYFSLLIEKFAEEVIGEECTVITSGAASVPGVLAMESDFISKILIIDPMSIAETKQAAGSKGRLMSRILCLPILGNALYNSLMSVPALQNKYDEAFRDTSAENYSAFIKDCHETSHIGNGTGRFLLAGEMDGPLLFDYSYSLGNLTKPACIMEGAYLDGLYEKVDAFKDINSSIKTTFINSTMAYPHIESPDNAISKMTAFIDG